MANAGNLEMKVVVGGQSEMRPCWVKDGESEREALFHCWEHRQDLISASVMAGGHPAGVISRTLAIVEYEDGAVHEKYPTDVRFTDTKSIMDLRGQCLSWGEDEHVQ